MTLKDLLERLYTAHDNFTSIQVAWQYSYQADRMDEVLGNWEARHPPGSVTRLTASKGASKTEREYQILKRVWWQKPSCWREEQLFDGEPTVTKIICYGQFWTFDAVHRKLLTNVALQGKYTRRGRPSGQTYIPTIEDAVAAVPLLDPSFLLASHALQPLEETAHAGRAAVKVRAVYQKGKDLIPEPFFWAAADEFELLVDVERGILLRYEARWRGNAYAVSSIDSIVFDEPIPEKVFSFTPPADAEVEFIS